MHLRNEGLKLRPFRLFIITAMLVLPIFLVVAQHRQFDDFPEALERYQNTIEKVTAYEYIIQKNLMSSLPLMGLFPVLVVYLLFGLESAGGHWQKLLLTPIDLRQLLVIKLGVAWLLSAVFSGLLLLLISIHIELLSQRYPELFRGYPVLSFVTIFLHYLFFLLKVILLQALVYHWLRNKQWIAFLIGVLGPLIIVYTLNPYNIYYRFNQLDYDLFLVTGIIYPVLFYVILWKTLKI